MNIKRPHTLIILWSTIVLHGCCLHCHDNDSPPQDLRHVSRIWMSNYATNETIELYNPSGEYAVVKVTDLNNGSRCACERTLKYSRSYRAESNEVHPFNCSTNIYVGLDSHTLDLYFAFANFHHDYRFAQPTTLSYMVNDSIVPYFPMTLEGNTSDNPIDSVYYSDLGLIKIVMKSGAIWWRTQ